MTLEVAGSAGPETSGSRRKVLLVLPDLRGGGAERVAVNLARQLLGEGYEVTIFLLQKRGVLWDEVPERARLVWGLESTRLRYGWPLLFKQLIEEARRHHVLIGTQELNATYAAWMVGLLTRKPVVAWLHIPIGYYLTRVAAVHSRLARFVYPRLDNIVCVSDGVRNALSRWLGAAPPGRCHIIYNAFDANAYDRGRASSIPGKRNPIPTLLALGRLEFQKGFDVLIRAHKLVRDRGLDHRLVIYGEGPDRAALEGLIAQLGVGDSVQLPGFIDKPIQALRESDVFVLSSRFEGFPMVLLEALAAGVPIVASDCEAGPREALADGEVGLLVRQDDPEALADAIEKMLRDAALQERCRSLGPVRAADFAPEKIASQWDALLSGLRG